MSSTDTSWNMSEVVMLLQQEFPEVTISKIRFMESQGLISPERSPSGYRHFYQADYERLHWILVQQRDSYLPLRVIRDRLNSGEMLPAVTAPNISFESHETDEVEIVDDDAPAPVAQQASPPQAAPPVETARPAPTQPSASSAEPEALRGTQNSKAGNRLDWSSELDASLSSPTGSAPKADLEQLKPSDVSSGAVSAAQPLYERLAPVEGTQSSLGLEVDNPKSTRPASQRLPGMGLSMTQEELAQSCGVDQAFLAELMRYNVIAPTEETGSPQFANETVEVVKLASEFAAFGLEPRHLRTILLSAEREVELYTQTVGAGLRAGNPETRRNAHRSIGELSKKAAVMRGVMIKRMLRNLAP